MESPLIRGSLGLIFDVKTISVSTREEAKDKTSVLRNELVSIRDIFKRSPLLYEEILLIIDSYIQYFDADQTSA